MNRAPLETHQSLVTPAARQHRLKIVTAFGLVYVFWGSTFLGIRIAVEQVPPLLLTGARFLTAGVLMLAWCAWSGRQIRINRQDFIRLLAIGLLLLTGGNVLVAWSEQYIPTGLAALLLAVTPIWIAVIEGYLMKKDRMTGRGWMGLALGVAGMGVLLWPKLSGASSHMGKMQLAASLVLTLASLSWTCGTLIAKHSALAVAPLVATGWEMTFSGLFNTGLGLALGDHHRAVWNARGIGAIVYLIIFGSWVGFTAYIWLLEHVPTPKVATYAYVNPVVAVFLGWLALHERIDIFIGAGTVVIVAAVALVTTAKLRSGKMVAEEELPVCEVAGD